MTFADAAQTLLFALAQTAWQGMVLAVVVGASCCVFRLSAAVRALLWALVAAKFVAGFGWLAFTGKTVVVTVPATETALEAVAALSPAFTEAVVGVYSLGILFYITRVASGIAVTRRLLHASRPVTDTDLSCLVARLAARLRLAPRRTPAVRTLTVAESPQVALQTLHETVLLFPAPLLPPAPTALPEPDLRLVVAHELAHVRRGDLWTGYLFAAMQALFFFHPGAWWAKHEWEAAREEACDALALQVESDTPDAGLTAARYGTLLLRFGGGTAPDVSGAGSAFLAGSAYRDLRGRLKHLFRLQSPPAALSRIAPWLVVPVVVALFVPVSPRFAPRRPQAMPAVAVATRLAPLHVPRKTRDIAKTASPRSRFPHAVAPTPPRPAVPAVVRRREASANPTARAVTVVAPAQPPVWSEGKTAPVLPHSGAATSLAAVSIPPEPSIPVAVAPVAPPTPSTESAITDPVAAVLPTLVTPSATTVSAVATAPEPSATAGVGSSPFPAMPSRAAHPVPSPSPTPLPVVPDRTPYSPKR